MGVGATAAAEICVSLGQGGEEACVPAGTPVGEVLARLDPSLAARAIAARVDGRLVDLSHPLRADARVEPVLPDSAEGLEVLRHSTAHLLAQAVQELFPGTQVTIGPVIEDGFYYDFARDEPFRPEDLERIEERMREIAHRDLPVRREEIPRTEAIERFRRLGEHYKVEILEGIPDEVVSLYHQGQWFDLCRGPHVPSTGRLGVFRLTGTAGAYWRGDERNPMLQRIYGTAWAAPEDLERHLQRLEEAKRRDHRRLGRELDLFSFHPVAPGSPFFHPKGAFVYNRLVGFIRSLYEEFGYGEVITPQIADVDLWRRSGHYENFREDMLFLEIEGREFGVKPMNCPGHALLYGTAKRSYRELPLRYADFSKLHRFERSGVLHGLTRVRTFSQDDAHVFCTPEQVEGEIRSVIRMARIVHRAFGLDDVRVLLSTRPDKRMGGEELWDTAERTLARALEAHGVPFETSPGTGSFYGPKIDFLVRDALRREWQLTTIQLDYNLPERFDLTYVTAAGTEARPVMIHRALLGSIERFLGVLLEHTGGALPLWLAPVQVKVLTVAERHEPYAREVHQRLRSRGFRVELDAGRDKLGYKIRQAQLEKVPYMLVLGDREVERTEVAPRRRSGGPLPAMPLERFIDLLEEEAREPQISSGEPAGGVP